jgi:hypothetical protein
MIYLRKAHTACKGRPSMLKEILVAMLQSGRADDIGSLISSAPEDVRNSPDVRIAEFEVVSQGLQERFGEARAGRLGPSSGVAGLAGLELVRLKLFRPCFISCGLVGHTTSDATALGLGRV